jgi:drug/metabolite transporter (DMT)-like permease
MIVSVAWVCAKPVLEYLDPLSFSISQFGLAAVFAFAWLLVSGELPGLARLTPGQWTFLVVTTLLFLAAVYTMWIGLSSIPATAAALLNRLEVLVIVFLGMALLGDRFTRREALGGGITLLGVIVLRYDAPSGFSAGFWMMVLSSMLFGLTEVLVKTRAHAIPPGVFAFGRNFLSFVIFLIAAVWRVAMQDPPWWKGLMDWDGVMRGLPLIAITALAGPVLARITFMHTLRRLDISRASLIQQITPLFVAVLSAIALRTLPSRREWTGGLLIMAGCLLLMQWGPLQRRLWRRDGPEEELPEDGQS